MEGARVAIARLLEVKSDDIIFTSGATEANALAIRGHAQALKDRGVSAIHMLYAPTAHASVIENMKALVPLGIEIEPLPIQNGAVDIAALAKLLRKETALVSMDAVCGETGVVWNTRDVKQALLAAGGTALLHVDASQAPLTEVLTRAHFGADLLTLDASKVAPVRGIGALVAHRTIALAPLYEGGGQERGLRPGSEAPELAEAFAAGLVRAAVGRESFRAGAERERARLVERIMADMPNIYIQEGASQAPHILNLSLPGRDTDYLVALLDEAGFAVSTRSACETAKPLRMDRSPGDSSDESPRDSEEGSRAVYALTGDRERSLATLRVSWNSRTKPRDLSRFARALREAVAFIDRGHAG